jgi:phosphoribosylaminoimidazole carboxylase (NCAIR synthetase)
VRVLAQLEKYGAGSRALLGSRDVLVHPSLQDASSFIGRAWCPTPLALAALSAASVKPEPHPAVAILRRVNHRRFAHELGGGLPDQHYVEDRAAVESLLRRQGSTWLLKRPLAFAGRGQLRAFRALSDKEWSWVDASLRQDGLIVEPLVVPTLELSQHGFVWPGGAYELGVPCVQEVSERGVFRGIRRASPNELAAEDRRALLQQTERVAEALGRAGYFGPFGIDAYCYEQAGRTGFCALGEINARYTMGFATGFPRCTQELSLG